MSHELTPARLVHPGWIIKRELEERGWTQKDLAEIMGRPESKISSIVRGTKRITPETAIALGEVFGTSAEVWINLESSYRLRQAQRAENESIVARRSRLYELLPMGEIVRRGWIASGKGIEELEQTVRQFLGVREVDEIPNLAASYRGSRGKTPSGPALAAWLIRARQLADSQGVSSFSRERFERGCVSDLLSLSDGIGGVSRVPSVLAEYGIRTVFLRHLPKTYLDGSAFYLRRKPVVALTLRYDRIDSFWFTIMHELAHIYRAHEGIFLDDLDAEHADEQEQDANRTAAEWLIPSQLFRRFVGAVGHRYSRVAIERFAREVGRHPGIVLGRLHREDKVPYRNLRGWLERVSPWLDEVMHE